MCAGSVSSVVSQSCDLYFTRRIKKSQPVSNQANRTPAFRQPASSTTWPMLPTRLIQLSRDPGTSHNLILAHSLVWSIVSPSPFDFVHLMLQLFPDHSFTVLLPSSSRCAEWIKVDSFVPFSVRSVVSITTSDFFSPLSLTKLP